MKRILLALGLVLSGASWASDPVTLDRNGVLWRLTATETGTVLVGSKDGVEVARSIVPFPLGLDGQSDSHLQLLADELTGKVVVAWQRNWSQDYSDLVLAVWNSGNWERVTYITRDASAHPRNPVLKLARATSTYPNPQNPSKTLTVTESFALLLWWQGTGDGEGAALAVLRLTADPNDAEALSIYPLDTELGVGLACNQPIPPEVVAYPSFGVEPVGPTSHILVASPSSCLLFIFQMRFELSPPPETNEDQGGLGAVAMRRRHTPIFGVRKVLPVTRELSAEGTRAVLGADLQPVLYRVVPEGVEYTVASDQGWSPKRLLKLSEGVTLDQAIALVENLAR
ncbi:hypothetical protein EG19_01505 [Thermoanaerobaculum aquaticum]|uniref:Uncharacterized protein n=1 Tax=Thermoanaerobaculum aquaticum TaxID=1312852 RepID=A0A062XT70_9BACT|nr:hypothetical protein [Thermoanaerobaculum aquaticum]KDA54023.1 hypothetical protein EG19_01505 [Thermoanaerobaculum aquaticum]